MSKQSNEVWFSFLGMKGGAVGSVAFIIAGGVLVLMGAVAWRLVMS